MVIKLILWCELIVPWFTLFFIDRRAIKRYMPVSILASLIVTILYEVAYTYKWWVLPIYIVPWGYITHISFVYGPFLIGTLWIFRLTYPHFLRYMLTNAIIDAIFAFGILRLAERLGIDRMVNISFLGVFLLCIAVAVLIFVYQMWQEGVFKEIERPTRESRDVAVPNSGGRFRRRGKVR